MLMVFALNPFSGPDFFILSELLINSERFGPLMLSWGVQALRFVVAAMRCGALSAARMLFAGVWSPSLGDHFSSAARSSGKLLCSHAWLLIGVKVCECRINIYHIPS